MWPDDHQKDIEAHFESLRRMDSIQLMQFGRRARALAMRDLLLLCREKILSVVLRIVSDLKARRQVNELASYDDYLLRDMGITRYDVLTKSRKSRRHQCEAAGERRDTVVPSGRSRLGVWRDRVRSLTHVLGACADRSKQRRMLARFSERDLSDVGISKCDADAEIKKPCWRL